VSSSTQLISTTRVSPSLNSLNTNKTTKYDVENPGSGLEQALNVVMYLILLIGQARKIKAASLLQIPAFDELLSLNLNYFWTIM
jgi:hypothetical protein